MVKVHKEFKTEMYSALGIVWWVWFGTEILTTKKGHKPVYSLTCSSLTIYNRTLFEKIIATKRNEILGELKYSFFDFDTKPISLKEVGFLAVKKLDGKCLTPNNIDSLTTEQKILYYILGLEMYDSIRELKFGNDILINQASYENWKNNILPQQLQNYKDFLGITSSEDLRIQLAYEKLLEKGIYP